jgi:hypothetical protein
MPANVRHEADLLQAGWIPLCAGERNETTEVTQLEAKTHSWNVVPSSVIERGVPLRLSGQARLVADCIYETSADGYALYCFPIVATSPLNRSDLQEELSEPLKLTLHHPIVSYDIDFDNSKLAILTRSDEGDICLTICHQDYCCLESLRTGSVGTSKQYEFREVEINGPSVLVSLGNTVQVFDWTENVNPSGEGSWHRLWTRNDDAYTRLDHLYVRASLLSPHVVSCTVLFTKFPFASSSTGDFIFREGRFELYRLDQLVPKVADAIIPSMSVHYFKLPIPQITRKYVFFNVGGKHALEDYLATGRDGPMIIQTFGEKVSI